MRECLLPQHLYALLMLPKKKMCCLKKDVLLHLPQHDTNSPALLMITPVLLQLA